ncbi:MAG: saccharopine dehydrogenase C-terminal domain-containing protein [Bacteroidota bacterium]
MKHILLFGAGKSATVLIDYLKQTAMQKQWLVTIADVNLAAVQAKVGDHPLVKAVGVSIEDETKRKALIEDADVVISLLPPSLHYVVALDCLAFGKHLLTASYVDDKIRQLADEIKEKNILFLCEMGLDPGIDHMSAMQLIHRIKELGGQIHSFLSHCGGLVAPESDTNPWHYKISWNPRNVVLAGKAGAVYREELKVKSEKYEELFVDCEEVAIEDLGQLAYYPNRDSLDYIPVYELEETETFIRTTLRHPDFCKGWNVVIDLGLTDEKHLFDTDSLTISAFLRNAFREKESLLTDPLLKEQFDFLGWDDTTLINKGHCSAADVLQFILEKKWVLEEEDKDMIVMLHEIEYEVKNQKSKVKSELVVKGEDNLHTAMAKTVGLPLGIAATLLLEGKINETGLHIPIIAGIYEPVLKVLAEHGIIFHETEQTSV